MVDAFIVPSLFVRNTFLNFGIPQRKIIFLRHGFNLDYFKNTQKSGSDKLRFAFIGNILPAKGVHILIEAFNRIKDKNVELKIYGDEVSYKGMLEDYLGRIRKMAKNKNIIFMGRFENKNIGDVFREIDVLIVPSVWQENSPLVIQEAFAAKTAVIASNIGGIPELISDGVNGLLFETNSHDSLYGKMKFIIANPRVLEKFKVNIGPPKDIKQNAQETEAIYEQYV